MLTHCADGSISGEATTQSSNIFPEAMRPPEPDQYCTSVHSLGVHSLYGTDVGRGIGRHAGFAKEVCVCDCVWRLSRSDGRQGG
jgi:hypothetical protein